MDIGKVGILNRAQLRCNEKTDKNFKSLQADTFEPSFGYDASGYRPAQDAILKERLRNYKKGGSTACHIYCQCFNV